MNGNDGTLKLTVNFEVGTDANTDQILTQMRVNQAASQLPGDVNKFGVTVKKVDLVAAHHVCAVFAEGNLRQRLSGKLRVHQPER